VVYLKNLKNCKTGAVLAEVARREANEPASECSYSGQLMSRPASSCSPCEHISGHNMITRHGELDSSP
jgi:hypothetical protein